MFANSASPGRFTFQNKKLGQFPFPADLARVGIADVAKKEGMQTAGWKALSALPKGGSG